MAKVTAQERGAIADLFTHIETCLFNRRSYQVLEDNKDLGSGDRREPLLVSGDDLIQLNLEFVEFPRLTFRSGHLNKTMRNSIERLLFDYKDCFSWCYTKIPSLDENW